MDQKSTTALIIVCLVPVMVLPLIISIVLLGGDDDSDTCTPVSSQAGGSVNLGSVPEGPIAGYGHEQLVNAAYIIQAGHDLGLTTRDQTIGVMTAMAESGLMVLDYGDAVGPDSRGLFQQRANGAWGSEEDRMDPYTSATYFFRVLQSIDDRESLAPTLVAHRVQANANPYVYESHWPAAVTVVEGLSGVQGINAAEAAQGSNQYALGDVQPQTAIVANKVGPMFGIKTVGGYRDATSPYDDMTYGHPAGRALDFMINDLPDGKAVGDRLAAYLQENAESLTVYYIIWQQRIWMAGDPPDAWKLMEDRGSDTQNHMDHVHLSLDVSGEVSVPAADDSCTTKSSTTSTTTVSHDGWASPGAGPVTSSYGMRVNPVTGVYRLHAGTDLGGGGCGGPIWAAQSGTVTVAGMVDGTGIITIDHGGGVETSYLHMYENGIQVRAGDKVTAGQQIGLVGSSGNSTGCHLHFEVHLDGSPTDPVPYMAQVGVTLGD
ncbi:M23 family metallopeptidase [Actinomyces sp. 565]|uniref:M23 family metallopeptidase n=1 Tax=Actinomyces sp. 565 TaxID=2057794 RepID=UPI0031B850CA